MTIGCREQAEWEKRGEWSISNTKQMREEERERNPYIVVPDEHQWAICTSFSNCFIYHAHTHILALCHGAVHFTAVQRTMVSIFLFQVRNVNAL